MTLGTKLVVAFLVVIGVMILGDAGYFLMDSFRNSRVGAAEKLSAVTKTKLPGDLKRCGFANSAIADRLVNTTSLPNYLVNHDRNSIANLCREVIERDNFAGFITAADSQGKVIYSSETPAKFDYPADRSEAVDFVLKEGKSYTGAALIGPTGNVSMTSIVPVKTAGKTVGVVCVGQAFNADFLSGLVTKFAIEPEPVTDIDMAVLDLKDNTLCALTPGLIGTNQPFIAALNDKGIKAVPRGPSNDLMASIKTLIVPPDLGFELDGRMWKIFRLTSVGDSAIADIFVTTKIPLIQAKVSPLIFLAAGAGGCAFLLSIIFIGNISKSVNAPLRLLIRRTSALANQKAGLPALDGIGGEWLELAELIDSAVLSLRQTTQSLKTQLAKYSEEALEKTQEVASTGTQLESLNRQYSGQSKQITELTKQVNQSNRQSILLQHKLDTVLQVSTEGFLLLDQFGNVLSANPTFLNWMGSTEAEIAGRVCFDLVKKPNETATVWQAHQTFAAHGGDPMELINQFYPEGIIHHRDGKRKVEVLAHLQPVLSDDANIQGFIMVLRDKSLRSEVAQLKSGIVTMLSDSIRSNLIAAEPKWGAIMRSSPQTMHPAVGEALTDLHSTYDQLIGLVDSFLMMYGGFVPPPVMARETFQVGRLIGECQEEVSEMARLRQLSLDYKSVSGLPNLNSNRPTVKGILVQILEKLISVTSPGGRVRVEASAKGSEMRIAVSSSGPALPDNEIADLFVGFQQGQHAESTYHTRLSMYLARNNVERLDGKIWAESEAGRGTSILFTIPLG